MLSWDKVFQLTRNKHLSPVYIGPHNIQNESIILSGAEYFARWNVRHSVKHVSCFPLKIMWISENSKLRLVIKIKTKKCVKDVRKHNIKIFLTCLKY